MKGKWHSIIGVLLALVIMASLAVVTAIPAAAAVTSSVDVDSVTAGVQAVLVQPNTAGSQARYTIGFATSGGAALTLNIGTIAITFPSGTTLPASFPANTVSVNGNTVDNSSTPAPLIAGRVVTITTPVTVVAGPTNVTVVFAQAAGILNPAIGSTTLQVRVATSDAVDNVATALTAYTVTPTISISPTSGPRGTVVTVTGAGFAALRSVDISLAGTNIGSTTSDANGAINTTVTIPSTAAAGATPVVGTDGAGTASPAATFTVGPSLTLTPSTGLAGTTVQLTGSAWTPSTAIGATVSAAFVAVAPGGVTTTAGGAIPSIAGSGAAANTTIVIPQASTPGDKSVTVTVGAVSATAVFTVTPRPLTLTPSSGPVGTIVTISGGNMTANGEIDPLGVNAQVAGVNGDITIAALTWVPGGASYVVDAAGNFSATLTIGAANAAATATTSSSGAQTVTVTDSGGRIASATFTITGRSITLSPTSGSAGSAVLVNGVGFPVSSTVILTDTTGVAGNWGSAQVDASGTFVFSAANRASAAAALQTITVTATGTTPAAVAVTATATFTVPAANLSISPESGPVGTSLTVSGTGFNPSAPVAAITIGGIQVLAAGVASTNTSGAFTTTITVPGLNTGATQVATTVTVAGAPVAITRLFTVNTAPASVGSALAPLGTNLVRVWAFNAATQSWTVFDPAVPLQSSLSVLTRGQGYWLKVTAAQTLTVGTNQYNLAAGWNLIGWLG